MILPGYSNVSTPAESSADVVLLYISNSFAFKQRHDLDSFFYLAKSLESIFVEIVNPNKPNIIVCVVYRHTGMSLNSLNSDFLKPIE